MSSGLAGIYGPNRVMCCLCFDGFLLEELYMDIDGARHDMCWGCAGKEAIVILRELVYGAERPISSGSFFRWLDTARQFLGLSDRSDRKSTTTVTE